MVNGVVVCVRSQGCFAKGSLPPRNRLLLNHVFGFLCEVAANCEVNKMTEENLAVVFGPNIMWSQDPSASLADMGRVNQFTTFMLANQQFEAVLATE
jgi:Rho GTPase-activating protein 1